MPSNYMKVLAETPPLSKRTFSRVREAREALRERANEFIDKYIQIVDFAIAKGDAESAYKAMQWLIDHIPADENGERIFDRSVDKVPPESSPAPAAPPIQIGIALGGITQPKKLTGKVIDADK